MLYIINASNILTGTATATIVFHLSQDQWIVGVINGGSMKMIKLNIVGSNTFDWIETKYNRDGNYSQAFLKLCVETFSESCFVGVSTNEDYYKLEIATELQGGGFKFFICEMISRKF